MSDESDEAAMSGRSSPESDFPEVSQIISSSPVSPLERPITTYATPRQDKAEEEHTNPRDDVSRSLAEPSSEISTVTQSGTMNVIATKDAPPKVEEPPYHHDRAPTPKSDEDSDGAAEEVLVADGETSEAALDSHDIDDLYTDHQESLPVKPKRKKKRKRGEDEVVTKLSRSGSHRKPRAVVFIPPTSSSRAREGVSFIKRPSVFNAKKEKMPSASQPPPESQRKHRSAPAAAPTTSRPSASQPPPLAYDAPQSSQPYPSPRPAKRARIPNGDSLCTPIAVYSSPPNSMLTTARRRSLSKAARHETYWHLDGSVVLLVERTLFKLHRSRLALQSAYFAELFQKAKGKRKSRTVYSDDEAQANGFILAEGDGLLEGELIDSCPVYRVSRVKVKDFEVLLHALESGIAFASKRPTFTEFASLLRASHALQFGDIRNYASQELRNMWPADLSLLAPGPSDVHKQHATEALALARHCGLRDMCKRAYYELLRSEVFGQNLKFVDKPDDDDFNDTLGQLDLLRLVRSREQLQHAWVRVSRAPPTPSVVPCPLEQIPTASLDEKQGPVLQGCRDARAASLTHWIAEVLQSSLFEDGMRDPLCAMQALCEKDWTGMGYCLGCASARRELWGEEMERLWRSLDEWLGLEGKNEASGTA